MGVRCLGADEALVRVSPSPWSVYLSLGGPHVLCRRRALTSPSSRVRMAGKGEEARDGFWPRTAGVPGAV